MGYDSVEGEVLCEFLLNSQYFLKQLQSIGLFFTLSSAYCSIGRSILWFPTVMLGSMQRTFASYSSLMMHFFIV
jgi:hypothetical protein